MKSKTAFAEKTVGCLISSGCFISLVSLVLAYVFGVAGVFRGTFTREPITNKIRDAGTLNLVPLAIFFLAVGIVIAFSGVIIGLVKHFSSRTGPRKVVPYLRILARFAYEKGTMLNTDVEIEMADRPRFYIRAMTPDQVVTELETTEAVFYQCAEGCVGEGELQGNWLGRFVPYIGTPSSSQGPNV